MKADMKKQIRGSLFLFFAALIWGVAFVAQSVGMNYVGPFTFTCSRSLVGGIVLLPLISLLDHVKADKNEKQLEDKKLLMLAGLICGILLCVATSFQQIGLMYTTVGKAGFITAFYIIMVPIFGLFFKRRCGLSVWIGVIIALFGLYFLCMTESFTIQKGDFLEFICALVFTFHILVIDHYGDKVNGVKLSCIQFFVCGVISGVLMLLFENPEWTQIKAAAVPILYAGVLSSGVGYTFQIIGQKTINPTVASLIMSLESVISVLAGLVLLGQQLSLRELIGCILMFIAIVLAQLPQKQ